MERIAFSPLLFFRRGIDEGESVSIPHFPAIIVVVLGISTSLFVTKLFADNGFSDSMEISGRLSTEIWRFPDSAAYSGQRSDSRGISLETTIYVEDEEYRSITFTPFFRYDTDDPERSHFDVREAYYLTYGDIGDDEWELRLGVDRVFWGVVESRPLVDIVNQTDIAGHPNEKIKLGQPMAHFTRSGEWGTFELFGITGHRERTFPGRRGRHRGGLVVNQNLVSYESTSREWNVDLATRYSGNFGPIGLGLSVFDGTSREPVLVPVQSGPQFMLIPYYEQIRQYGLDVQVTTGSLLLKLEAIHRTGAKNSRLDEFSNLRFEEKDFSAWVLGGEYTFYSIWGTNSDLGLFVEWAYDERGQWAPHAFENDLFLALHLGLNDVQSTEFIFSSMNSLDNDSHTVGAEFKRRLSDNWYLHIEALKYLEFDEDDAIYSVRRDSFVRVKLDYNF